MDYNMKKKQDKVNEANRKLFRIANDTTDPTVYYFSQDPNYVRAKIPIPRLENYPCFGSFSDAAIEKNILEFPKLLRQFKLLKEVKNLGFSTSMFKFVNLCTSHLGNGHYMDLTISPQNKETTTTEQIRILLKENFGDNLLIC